MFGDAGNHETKKETLYVHINPILFQDPPNLGGSTDPVNPLFLKGKRMKLFTSLLLLVSPAILFATDEPIAEDFFAYPRT